MRKKSNKNINSIRDLKPFECFPSRLILFLSVQKKKTIKYTKVKAFSK